MSARIVVEKSGSGDLSVFVHGLGGSSNVFYPQAQVLSRFFTCLRPDLPGTARHSSSGPLSISSLAEHLSQLIDAEGDAPVHLIGHSMGTVVCQHVAAARPAKIRTLSLIGPLLAPPDPARTALRDRAAKARAGAMPEIADAIVAGGTSAHTRAAQPAIAALVREMILRQDPASYAASCEALADAQPADVARITCPVLLITGAEDGTAPPAAVRRMGEMMPDAIVRILIDSGHWATFEKPAEVSDALVNFLVGGTR
jgi:3-oxoadipate enol-lactonase